MIHMYVYIDYMINRVLQERFDSSSSIPRILDDMICISKSSRDSRNKILVDGMRYFWLRQRDAALLYMIQLTPDYSFCWSS